MGLATGCGDLSAIRPMRTLLGDLALRELCLCIQKHAHVTCLSVCFFMSFEQFHDDVAGDP